MFSDDTTLLESLVTFVAISFFVKLIPQVFYMLTLQRTLNQVAPEVRRMAPSQVWLGMIPFFDIVWQFITVNAMSESITGELQRRSLRTEDDKPGYGLGIAMSVLWLTLWIPYVCLLTSVGWAVCFVMYWVKISQYKKLLEPPVQQQPAYTAPVQQYGAQNYQQQGGYTQYQQQPWQQQPNYNPQYQQPQPYTGSPYGQQYQQPNYNQQQPWQQPNYTPQYQQPNYTPPQQQQQPNQQQQPYSNPQTPPTQQWMPPQQNNNAFPVDPAAPPVNKEDHKRWMPPGMEDDNTTATEKPQYGTPENTNPDPGSDTGSSNRWAPPAPPAV